MKDKTWDWIKRFVIVGIALIIIVKVLEYFLGIYG